MTDISRRAFMSGMVATVVTVRYAAPAIAEPYWSLGWPANEVPSQTFAAGDDGSLRILTEEEQRKLVEWAMDSWSRFGLRIADRGGSLVEDARFRIRPDWREASGWDK